ncbi:hypothetical protein [Pontiella sp.]|uniref:type IV pilus modification PilV family protein n=1 Tax=Pontiella sp. TaxID=2837462 RepID=UPI003568B22C
MQMNKNDHQNTPSNRSRSGTSLIETVVALSLLAVFIAGSCRTIVAHRKIVDKARAHYTAVNIAKNQVEQIRNTISSVGYDQIYNNAEKDIQVAYNGEVSDVGKFRRTTEVIQVDENLTEIVITVQIINRISLEFGTEKEVLRTYIARPLERSS